MEYINCKLCPRGCGVNREAGEAGFCGAPAVALVAKTMLHRWEEPALSPGGKSGAVTSFCPPCGICRQVLAEFAQSDARVILFDGENAKALTLRELLPHSFAKNNVD